MAKLTDEQKKRIKDNAKGGFTDEEINEMTAEQMAGKTGVKFDKLTMGQLFAANRAGEIAEQVAAGNYQPNPDAEIKERTTIPLLPLIQLDDTAGNYYLTFSDDPEGLLNPTSPNFNRTEYETRLAEMQEKIDELGEMVTDYVIKLTHKMAESVPAKVKEAAADFMANLPQMLENITKWVKDNLQGVDFELLDYITKELEKPENKTLLDKYGTMGELTKAPEWQGILAAARQAKLADEKATLPMLDGERVKGIDYPISKVNREVWDKARGEVSGQYKLSIDTTPKANPVTVSVNMDALPPEVLKNLSHFDRRVWTAAVSLWTQGCRVVSAANIFYAMGNNSKPNPAQIEKIDKSMYKMGATYIQIDNLNEAASTNYDLFFRDKFYLLKVEGTSAINPANGKVINSAYILPDDEPKLLTFARMRGQVTTISRAVFAAPITQNENGLKLHDYLIDRIIAMRREPEHSRKIKLDTICDYMGTTSKHKDRLKEQIYNLLTYFADPQGGNFIAGWRSTTKAEEKHEPAGYYIELKTDALPDNSKGKK